MDKENCWQNEGKTEVQPEDKMEDAPSKWKDERKKCELPSDSNELREVRKKMSLHHGGEETPNYCK